ncbi:chaoptin [Halyomorpha halys]|uniref:chaoptin n=1 Tax=Halyomorpha halys TaxID=286706 RepID=UPI0034D18A85
MKILIVLLITLSRSGSLPCSFNRMCSCKTLHNATQDVSCVSVPLSRIPDFPTWTQNVDVLESGLEVVESDSMVLPLLVSLRLTSNRLLLIQEKAMLSTKSLRSLDLSYNKLEDIPVEALRHIHGLEWLNLHGNSISLPPSDWGGLKDSLTHLFLGENDLEEADLGALKRLTSAGLDGNRLQAVRSLPTPLHTLSLSHNHLHGFPSLSSLSGLSWLYLRDNFIATLRGAALPSRPIDKLDLGWNLLTGFDLEPRNSTIIRDLNLEHNSFKTLPESAFKGITIGRISLSRNKLETINDKVFNDLSNVLEYLDIGGNRLQKIPRALSAIKKLKYLYIPSNNISEIQSDALSSFSETLGALSLSGNKLESIPKQALKKCRNLAHLNLGYNSIREVREEDFLDWGGNLDTLLLMNNRIVELQEHTFRQTPRLRELSLSFNKIASVHSLAFADIGLESLEISFGLYHEDFPEDFLLPLTNLMWLALDNNNFRTISETAFQSLSSLRYLNLDGNRISHLPPNIFIPRVHQYLRDIRISDNHLQNIETNTFVDLDDLQYIVLFRNQIKTVYTRSFANLRHKVSIYLGENRIWRIEAGAFDGIKNFLKLDLQSNDLHELSLDIFSNSTCEEFPLNLNLSRNFLSSIETGEQSNSLYIKGVDLSYNSLNEIPSDFFGLIKTSIRRIDLSYNQINKLGEEAFGPLFQLESLALEHNEIVKIRKRAFAGLENLQVLDLSHNHLEQLHMEQFKHLVSLRILDLSFNHLRSIPRDAFINTKLERIDLSNNEFLVMPSASLGEIGFTLRVLDASHNQIEHLDSTMFPETPLLTSLSLANNKITLVPDNVFTSLANLLRLDLSGNKIRANLKELFHYLQALRELNLAATGTSQLPVLPLPNLAVLNVSHNPISDFPIDTATALPRLRTLTMSNCNFLKLPSDSWPKLTLLKHLDVSYNPIKELVTESFSGLRRLDHLEMVGLERLERLEQPRGLTGLRFLSLDAGPGLQTFVQPLTTLTSLSLRVLQPKLGQQLAKMPPKICRLEFTGHALKEVSAGALSGLRGEAVISFRDTSVEELPLGLLSGLEAVSHLTLDIRNNRITSLSPDTFYYNLTAWEDVGTKLISGGLLLKDNPLTCDCSLVWLGHWLRRWLRESLLIQTADPEISARLTGAAREASCRDRDGRRTALLDLRPEHLSCQASALSAASGLPPPLLLPIIVAVLAFS